ncbi:hypothetical protein M2352_003378 [Azospirillum fermentarium]|uniref:hypothetical protein n=1 Tax=Azospirillum fermentarium TaxID=1233114 RepID=UPI002225F18C|nr:hypothetical protein [Azospirillum fermentarium]MCW2247744.1 hypothetical protein [Azospirillum fermentarium]
MDEQSSLIKLTVEYWRLLRVYERSIRELPEERRMKLASQLRFQTGRLDSILGECGVRAVAYDGEPYLPTLPVTVLNSEEVFGSDALAVSETVEPTIVREGRVLSMGKVILRREEQ